MAKLVVTERGQQRTLAIESTDVVEIGRDESCAIRIADAHSSRKHCRILGTLSGFELVDLGSSNGTVHNGMRIERVPLIAGDRIQIGEVRIEFITEPNSEQEMASLGEVQTPQASPTEKPTPSASADGGSKSPAAKVAFQKSTLSEDEPHLIVVNGPLEGQRVALTAPFLIGRKESCDLVIPDRKSSGEHARIEQQGDRWIITDLESGNGLFIGKNRIRKHKLVDGDMVVIGDTCLRMRGLPTDPAMNDASSASQVFRAVDEGGISEDDLSRLTPRMIEEENKLQWVYTLAFVACLSLIVYFGRSMFAGLVDSRLAFDADNLLGTGGSFENPPPEGWAKTWVVDPSSSDPAELVSVEELGLPHGKMALGVRSKGGDHKSIRIFERDARDFAPGDAFLIAGRLRNQGFSRVGLVLRWYTRRGGELVPIEESYTELTDKRGAWTRLTASLSPPRFGEPSAYRLGFVALGAGSVDFDDLSLRRVAEEPTEPLVLVARAGGIPLEVSLNDRGIIETLRDGDRWIRQLRLAPRDFTGDVPWGQLHPDRNQQPVMVENGAIRNNFELDGVPISQVTQVVGGQVKVSFSPGESTESMLVFELDRLIENQRSTLFDEQRTVVQGAPFSDLDGQSGDEWVLGNGADQMILRLNVPGRLDLLSDVGGRGGRALTWTPLKAPPGGVIDCFMGTVSDRERRRVDDLWNVVSEQIEIGQEGAALAVLANLESEFHWRADVQTRVRQARATIHAAAEQGYEELLAVRSDLRSHPDTPISGVLVASAHQFADRFAGSPRETEARALAAQTEVEIGGQSAEADEVRVREILAAGNRYFEQRRDLIAKFYYEWLLKEQAEGEEARIARLRLELIEARQ